MQIKRLIPTLYYSFSLFLFFVRTKNLPFLLSQFTKLKQGNKRLKLIVNKKKFIVRDLYDTLALKEVFVDKIYAALFKNLDDKTTYVDLGGYIGDSAVFASGFEKVSQIIIVEPFPDNLELIKENISLNKIKNVKIIASAVANDKGKKTFFVHQNKGQSGFSKNNENVSKIEILSTTLSEIVKLIKTDHAILKCDIEGEEYEIFMNTLPRNLQRFDKIIFEYHMSENKLKKLLSYLTKLGFSVSFNKHIVEPNLGNAFCEKV